MYPESTISATKVLIVKTSALGDIIQSFGVLDFLVSQIPNVIVDWAVEASLSSIVAAHPLVRNAIPLNIKGIRKSLSIRMLLQEIKVLRKEKYDLVFDLQKNTKSGLVTALCRSPIKVGFGYKTVREWPNLLATNKRFDVPSNLNIRLQYVGLLERYFKNLASPVKGVRFKTDQKIKLGNGTPRIMVCPGSKWVNKQLPTATWIEVLKRIHDSLGGVFYLMWGDDKEKQDCRQIQDSLGGRCIVVDKLSIPVWQNLIEEMDLVIAVDSSALHLCGTTTTPSFSLFGPTAPEIFKPLGPAHHAIQGSCPYGKTFVKQCPILRTCPTGACIRTLTAERIYTDFTQWWSERDDSKRSKSILDSTTLTASSILDLSSR